ncbi:MAG TPA: 50S ribosomal protein L35 [Bdellovibrionota bacterium]|nr:50S ribosomal protein L35 [Bdellovibrionota bacterium]
MPKLKTKQGVAKRFRVTKSGKIKHKKSNLRHILTTKGPKRKRHLRGMGQVAAADEKRIQLFLPYGHRG